MPIYEAATIDEAVQLGLADLGLTGFRSSQVSAKKFLKQ